MPWQSEVLMGYHYKLEVRLPETAETAELEAVAAGIPGVVYRYELVNYTGQRWQKLVIRSDNMSHLSQLAAMAGNQGFWAIQTENGGLLQSGGNRSALYLWND